MTTSLGDKFAKEYLESLFSRYLKPGAIFKLLTHHTTPPKIKRFVVVGIEEKIFSIAFLFINSEINLNIIKTPHLKSLQMPLAAYDRTYLDHDSYLDCSHLYEWSLHHLKEKYISNTKIYLGQLSDSDLEKAKRHITSAKTITKKLKTRYGFLE